MSKDDCAVWVSQAPWSAPGVVTAGCNRHGVRTDQTWTRPQQALADFRCDRGLRLRFVIEMDDGSEASICDLPGLARLARGEAEASVHGGGDRSPVLWMWLGNGQLEALVLAAGPPSPYDEDDYAAQRWTVTRADGQVLVTVTVTIDGRA